jgi:hypothetical protein
MIDYNTFLANVQDEDIRMMTLAANGQRIVTQSATEADAYQAELTRLFTNGLLTRAERGWEMKDGILWHTFDAVVEPLAIAYIIQLAMERYKINRNPLP